MLNLHTNPTRKTMRRPDHQQPKLFYSFCPESLIPADHPLRAIKKMVDESLKALDEQFSRMYSSYGRPGIPPERLLKGLLLQVLLIPLLISGHRLGSDIVVTRVVFPAATVLCPVTNEDLSIYHP